MPTAAQHLRAIRSTPELVQYLEEYLDWPLDGYEFEDLTYEYDAAELGLKPEETAKIKRIHQLRPMASGQPWGIFFVEFEPKKLPVAVLRRILSRLVVTKRSAPAGRAAWALHDLLFIASFGEVRTGPREIAFAHFQEEPNFQPTLRVLGWDGNDTALKLDYVAEVLQQQLKWPDNPADHAAWQRQWQQAFRHRLHHPITTADALAERLAELARRIRDAATTLLLAETDQGPLRPLHQAFQATLIHDLSQDDFADTYAQTITYGLLTAAISRTDLTGGRHGTALVATDVADLVPITNPFLKEMLEVFLKAGGNRSRQQGGIDFDELGIQDVVELLRGTDTDLPAILRDFGNRTRGEDPVIHFYEHFLRSYNKALKIKRGVFYTPQAVVSYIVRSVHELLQTEFSLPDGLADTSTWAEVAARQPGLRIPAGTDPASPFVTVLDPATGTGTFLVEVIEVIHRTLHARWKAERLSEAQQLAAWNAYVPQHLLPRLFGYELMMAPYAIAHMKIGLKLTETRYNFRSPERARIYLTNALEPAQDFADQFAFAVPALAHEAQAVNVVKRTQRFTVVVGNPPYSADSANMSDAAKELIKEYRSINGISLGERKIYVQDDYKKFIRFSQLRLVQSGIGVLGFITNHGFINEPTGRGMRHNLLLDFPRISIIDLHGSVTKREVCPDGTLDKNVFDIETGVALSFFRLGGVNERAVTHGDLWGMRDKKYDFLSAHSLSVTSSDIVDSLPDFYLFSPQDKATSEEFSNFSTIREVFKKGSNGIQTSRDHVVYGFEPSECQAVAKDFLLPESSLSTADLREKYWAGKKADKYLLGDTRGWSVVEARASLRKDKNWMSKLRDVLYRPFDVQTLFYSSYMIDWPRTDVMSQMLRPNLALCVGRAGSAADSQEWNIAFVSDKLVDMNLFYRGGNVTYPLYFDAPAGLLSFGDETEPNLYSTFVEELPDGASPETIFHYIYSIFYSPTYRSRYAEFLKIDFPRIPLPGSRALFEELAGLGEELVALHLLESARLDTPISRFEGTNRHLVRVGEKGKTLADVAADGTGRVAINDTSGFVGVPPAVWNFQVGGYQVCHKWLDDRRKAGRSLSDDDISHYNRVVVALHETIGLMQAIDEVVEQHGGWPGAFQGAAAE